jgi:DNA-binding NarL/FixJ family response regulator
VSERQPGDLVKGVPGRGRTRATRVLIVEDERLLAEMLADVIAEESDMRVVGVAGTVAEAAALASRQPDVVLMDYRLPDGTGAQATLEIKARWPTARVVMLSAVHDDETVMDSIRAGADGYLTKDRAVDELVAAVRAARAGETLLPTAVILAIARRVAAAHERQDAVPHIEPLTARQLAILREFASGRSTHEICERLSVTPNTLRTHADNIMHKFGVHSKLEAVAFGLRNGLIESPRDEVSRPGGT